MINEILFKETVKKWQGKYFTRSLGKDRVFLYLKKISKIESRVPQANEKRKQGMEFRVRGKMGLIKYDVYGL